MEQEQAAKNDKKKSIIDEYKEAMNEKVFKIQRKLGIQKKEDKFMLRALTCSGFAKEYNEKTNEKIMDQDALATVGDAILSAILSEHLFRENQEITSDEITQKKSELEENDNLETLGMDFDIDKYLLYRNNELEGKKKRATALEAIIGAVYLSNGIDDTKKVIEKFKLITS